MSEKSMVKNGKPLLDLINGEENERRPVWLMRQAGRYLPEYKGLREKNKNFMEFCLTPELSAEATMQPLRRFDLDAAIIFSDIMMMPFAFGQSVDFVEGVGPVLGDLGDIKKLTYRQEKIFSVLEAIKIVKGAMPEKVSFIGFCGGVWTVSCYMLQGRNERGFSKAVSAAEKNEEDFQVLSEKIIEASVSYLKEQISAGVEVVQIFESWAGLLRGKEFEKYVIEPTRKIVSGLKSEYPKTPIIGFPRGASANMCAEYYKKTGIDVLSLSENLNIKEVRNILGDNTVLQGNLNPEKLVSGGDEMREEIMDIIISGGKRHVFNLGHGVAPNTPLENVTALIETIREAERA